MEKVERSSQELEALHRDVSQQGITGITAIADLFEDTNHALRKLEEHTDARETPSDVFEALQQDFFAATKKQLCTSISTLKGKIISGKQIRLERLKKLKSKLSGTDLPLSSDFKQRLGRLEPLFVAASGMRLPLFAQVKELEHVQSDLDCVLHQAQQHSCWRLNIQINELSVKLSIRRRFKT